MEKGDLVESLQVIEEVIQKEKKAGGWVGTEVAKLGGDTGKDNLYKVS